MALLLFTVTPELLAVSLIRLIIVFIYLWIILNCFLCTTHLIENYFSSKLFLLATVSIAVPNPLTGSQHS